MKADLIITNCSLLTPDYHFRRGVSIAITNGKIAEIDTADEIKNRYQAEKNLSGRNKLAIPGLIDGHTHMTQQFLRGMISDEYPVIYLRFNLPLESKLTEEEVELSVKLSCLEMIKSGTTSFADAGGTHMERVVEAVSVSGLRASLTRTVSDRGELLPDNMKESCSEAVRRSEEFYKSYDGLADDRIRAWFQYRSIASCTDRLIVELTELSREHKTGIHTHISEYSEAILHAQRNHRMREIEYLGSLGVLGSNLLAAHCILISENDINLLRDNGVKVIHCPRSNLGKGVSKTPSLLNHGVSVGFGSDGTAHSGLSLFRELTAFRHAQIVTHGVPYQDYSVMNSTMMIDMLTMGGARALLRDQEIGSLEVGKRADIVLIDIDQPHITPTHNMLNTLTEAVDAKDVSDTIVDGNILMENRVVKSLDEERLRALAKEMFRKINHINGWTDDKLFTT